eukprot:15485165-Alexandrium_andersonii.AAC.1
MVAGPSGATLAAVAAVQRAVRGCIPRSAGRLIAYRRWANRFGRFRPRGARVREVFPWALALRIP